MAETIPVLDIRNGKAVGGRSGLRDEYRPLKSIFSSDSDPVKIAAALPFTRLYVADLDGIVNQKPDMRILKKLSALKSSMIDLGIRNSQDLMVFDGLKADVVLGSETLKSSNVISEALVRYPGRVLISIDIKDDRVISGFLENDPLRAYQQIIELGVDRVIFLNISAVGTGKPNFSFMKGLNKTGEIILGGGITKDDLAYMEKNHVDGVLVGTSLHRGLWM